jgi:hypothetical protein
MDRAAASYVARSDDGAAVANFALKKLNYQTEFDGGRLYASPRRRNLLVAWYARYAGARQTGWYRRGIEERTHQCFRDNTSRTTSVGLYCGYGVLFRVGLKALAPANGRAFQPELNHTTVELV